MRNLILIAFLGLIAGSASWVFAQSSESGARTPLDLPSGGQGANDEEEDEPETVTFYGSDYEGDGFFWCLDRSCSMGWGGEIQTLKQECTQAIQQLSSRAEFGLVRFSSSYDAWSTMPQKASPGSKSSANGWVQSMTANGSTCIGAPGVATLNIANQSSKRRKQVLILGDGVPQCGAETASSVIADITGANFNSIPIHTLFISASTAGVALFQSLASQNSGTFTQIQ